MIDEEPLRKKMRVLDRVLKDLDDELLSYVIQVATHKLNWRHKKRLKEMMK